MHDKSSEAAGPNTESTSIDHRRRSAENVALVVTAIALSVALLWKITNRLRPDPTPEMVHRVVTESRFQIDINTAQPIEWAQLPGIGPTLSRRIVQHREAHGPFPSVDALQDVKGIGPRTLESIRPWLSVRKAGPRPTQVETHSTP